MHQGYDTPSASADAVHYCAEFFGNDGSALATLFKSLKRLMAEESREIKTLYSTLTIGQLDEHASALCCFQTSAMPRHKMCSSDPLPRPNAGQMAVGVLFICQALCWVPQAHAESCAKIFTAIRKEAMYCGFFCDEGRILALQQSYETGCIKSVVAPSPFDIDSASLDAALLQRKNLSQRAGLLP